MFHLLWLSLCAIYVLLGWLVQHGRAAQTAYWEWYQQKATQDNFAREFAKAAWGLLLRNTIALHAYAEGYLDQYQGQQPEEPDDVIPAIAPAPIQPVTAATPAPPTTPVSFIRPQAVS